MLGRLQMTTRDALRAHNEIAGAVFCKANRKPSFNDGAFKATTLEKQIQDLVAAKELRGYILRENSEAEFAKNFCVRSPSSQHGSPTAVQIIRCAGKRGYQLQDLGNHASDHSRTDLLQTDDNCGRWGSAEGLLGRRIVVQQPCAVGAWVFDQHWNRSSWYDWSISFKNTPYSHVWSTQTDRNRL